MNPPPTTLGIDLGTGSVKVASVRQGRILARASRSYPVQAPHPGWALSDPEDWLSATLAAAAEVLAEAPAAAVGFTGQMHGVVLADADLTPRGPAILWADTRSAAQADALADLVPPGRLARLGSPAVPGFAATTLRWLREEQPAAVPGAVHVLQPKDWLRARLGGHIGTDPSDASGTLLCDVDTASWAADICTWAGVRPDQLPPILPSAAAAGQVTLGSQRLPAVIGAADTACALLSLGHGAAGFLAVGTGAQVVRPLTTPVLDPTLRTHTLATAGPCGSGWYRLGAVQNAGLAMGVALAWLGASVAEATAALAAGIAPTDPVFVPYLAGERTPFMDPHLRGAWLDLGLATDRAALLRSVLEGLAQAVALAYAAVFPEPVTGPVAMLGGGSQDAHMAALLTDAVGVPLRPSAEGDGTVLAAAGLAGVLLTGAMPGPPTELRAPLTVDPGRHALLAERRSRLLAHLAGDR